MQVEACVLFVPLFLLLWFTPGISPFWSGAQLFKSLVHVFAHSVCFLSFSFSLATQHGQEAFGGVRRAQHAASWPAAAGTGSASAASAWASSALARAPGAVSCAPGAAATVGSAEAYATNASRQAGAQGGLRAEGHSARAVPRALVYIVYVRVFVI